MIMMAAGSLRRAWAGVTVAGFARDQLRIEHDGQLVMNCLLPCYHESNRRAVETGRGNSTALPN
jgi:hypothetical protein